jgi:hypothetical protein
VYSTSHTPHITPFGENFQENAERCIFHNFAPQGRKNPSSRVSVKGTAGLVECSWQEIIYLTLFTFIESVNIFNNLNYLPSQLKDISQTVKVQTVVDDLTKICTLSTSRTYYGRRPGENYITF